MNGLRCGCGATEGFVAAPDHTESMRKWWREIGYPWDVVRLVPPHYHCADCGTTRGMDAAAQRRFEEAVSYAEDEGRIAGLGRAA